MATILYTNEELEQFVTRASCCASNQAYKALRAAQVKGKNTCEQNKHNYLEMAICTLGDYTPIGTILEPGVSPHAAIAATCVINFFDLFGNTLFLTLETSIGGVIVYPQVSYTIGTTLSDYATLQDFVDDFVIYINANVSSPDYTATNVGTTVTLTAVTTGASVNGMITNMLGEAIKFTYINVYKVNPLAVITPCFGCYDPVRDEIIFTGYDSNEVYILDPNTNLITLSNVPGGARTWDIIYNPINARKYISLPTSSSIYRLDSANTVVVGNLASEAGTNFGVYNPIVTANYPDTSFAFTCDSATNRIVIYDANTEAQIWNLDISTYFGVTAALRDINYNPQVGAYQGYYYAAVYGPIAVGDYRIVTVAPDGTIGDFPTTVDQPLTCKFIEIGLGTGNYELWVMGASMFIDRISEDGTLLGTIPLGIAPVGRKIAQNPINGYVYLASDSPVCNIIIIRPTDLQILSPNMDVGNGAEGVYGIVAYPDGRMYLGLPSSGDQKIVELTTTEDTIDDDYVFSGGEDEVTEEIPAVIVTEDDGNNCLTQEEAYIIIENVKKICGCCCEFEDDVLQKDISSTQ